MIVNGFGTFMEFNDIAKQDRCYNADKSKMASFWIQKHSEDRWDDDTIYSVALWDVATKQELEFFSRCHKYSKSDGGESGQPITRLEFDGAGALQVVFADGSQEPAEEPEQIPPWILRQQEKDKSSE